jgi:hypothetical protein
MAIRVTDVEMVLPADEEIVATGLREARRGRWKRRRILSTHEISPVRSERLAGSSAGVGELMESGGVGAAGGEKRRSDAVTFRPSGRAGEHFARNAVQRVVEFLVAAIPVVWSASTARSVGRR